MSTSSLILQKVHSLVERAVANTFVGAARVYNASLAPAGHDWAQLVGPSPSLPWDHAVMPAGGAGGTPIQLPRWSLVVVTLSTSK